MTRVALALLVALAALALGADVVEAALGVRHDVADAALSSSPAGWPHLLGCDGAGQDRFARLLFGARVSLAVGLIATLLSTSAGALLGITAGYARGAFDAVLMRVVDAALAIPVLPLLLLASATSIGRPPAGALASTAKLVLLLAGLGWMSTARLARAEVLRISAGGLVDAARALGAGPARILTRHVLPHAAPTLLVAATLDVGKNILAEAALSFLGLGLEPPLPSWGNMMRDLELNPGLAFWPGSCILLTVACVTVLGEHLRARGEARR